MRCDVNVSVRPLQHPPPPVSVHLSLQAGTSVLPHVVATPEIAPAHHGLTHYTGCVGVAAGDASLDGISASLSNEEDARAAALGYWTWHEGSDCSDALQFLNKSSDVPFGPRVELKNLASIRAVEAGIDAESRRQIALLESGSAVVSETRSFDVATGISASSRGKEGDSDYRFMREPDLRPLVLSEAFVLEQVCTRAKASRKCSTSACPPPPLLPPQIAALPELPDATHRRLVSTYGLSEADAASLLREEGGPRFFEAVLKHAVRLIEAGGESLPEATPHPQTPSPQLTRHGVAKTAVNWILNELLGQLARLGSASSDRFAAAATSAPNVQRSAVSTPAADQQPASAHTAAVTPSPAGLTAPCSTLHSCGLEPAAAGELLACVLTGSVSARAAKDVLTEMLLDLQLSGRLAHSGEAGELVSAPRSPRAIIEERGWGQLNDPAAIRAICQSVAADPSLSKTLAKYRAGNERVLGAFVSRAIEASGGVANPVLVSELMAEVLGPVGTRVEEARPRKS